MFDLRKNYARKKLPSSIHSVLTPPCHSGLLCSWKLSVPQNKKQLQSGLKKKVWQTPVNWPVSNPVFRVVYL